MCLVIHILFILYMCPLRYHVESILYFFAESESVIVSIWSLSSEQPCVSDLHEHSWTVPSSHWHLLLTHITIQLARLLMIDISA